MKGLLHRAREWLAPRPGAPPAAPARNGMKVSLDFLMGAKAKPGMTPAAVFAPAAPPKFAVPAGDKGMAQDSALMGYGSWAASAYGAMISEGQTFMGYPHLAELAQRPEYRVISKTIAGEMTRRWVEFKAAGEADDKADKIAAIEQEFKRLGVRKAFRRASEIDGFFGRAHILLETGADDDELGTPLGDGWDEISKSKIGKGSLKAIQVIEPVWLYASDYNSNDPLRPDWYRPRTWYVMGKRVHASRLLTFVSREVPDLLKPAYSFGGLSLTQMAKPYVDNWLRTRQSVADIVYNFSVNVLKTNMADALSGASGTDIVSRVAIFNTFKQNQGTLVLDKDSEDFANVAAPLSSLDALQAQAQEHIAAVSQIPLVKLTGISPSGLNASSEGEIAVFYDMIHELQEADFRDHLHKLLGIVQLSLFGGVDPDITFDFLPLEEMNEKEKAELRKIEAETDNILVEIGAVSPEDVRNRVANDPDTPYAGLDLAPAPGEGGEASPEQWAAALGGGGKADEGASSDLWAKALGATPEAVEADSGASGDMWAKALGASSDAGASPAQWSKALGMDARPRDARGRFVKRPA